MRKTKIILALGLSLSGCSMQTTSCVARGAEIRTPSGLRRIEDLEVGDEIFCVDEASGELHSTEITHIVTAMREVGSVKLGGRELKMTSDHPVYDPETETYEPAGDWFLGKRTQLLMSSGDEVQSIAVDEVKAFVGMSEVFDLTVAHDLHNFIADGIVVHNKSFVQTCSTNGESVEYGTPCAFGGRLECNDDGTGTRCVGGVEPSSDVRVDAPTADVALVDMSADLSIDVQEDLATDAQPDADPFELPDGFCCCQYQDMDIVLENAAEMTDCMNRPQGMCIDVDPNRLTPHSCCPNATGERCGPG